MKLFISRCSALVAFGLIATLNSCAGNKKSIANIQEMESITVSNKQAQPKPETPIFAPKHPADKNSPDLEGETIPEYDLTEGISITSCWASISLGMKQSEIEILAGRPDETFLSPKRIMPLFARSLFETDPDWLPEVAIRFGSTILDPDLYKKAYYDEAWVYYTPDSGRTKNFYVYFDKNKKVVKLSSPTDPGRKAANEVSLEFVLEMLNNNAGFDVRYDPSDIQNISIKNDPEPPIETNISENIEYLLKDTCSANNLVLIKKIENDQTIYWIKKQQIEPAH